MRCCIVARYSPNKKPVTMEPKPWLLVLRTAQGGDNLQDFFLFLLQSRVRNKANATKEEEKLEVGLDYTRMSISPSGLSSFRSSIRSLGALKKLSQGVVLFRRTTRIRPSMYIVLSLRHSSPRKAYQRHKVKTCLTSRL